MLKCMVPHTSKAKWYSSIIPQLPQHAVLNFNFFGAVHIKSHKSSMYSLKNCEIKTNKELIVPYDHMKPCRSPPGDFVLPTNTHPVPTQPRIENRFKSSTEKFQSCFCEAPKTCTPTLGPIPVSSSIPIVQKHSIPLLRRHQLPTTTLLSPCHPVGRNISKSLTCFHLALFSCS